MAPPTIIKTTFLLSLIESEIQNAKNTKIKYMESSYIYTRKKQISHENKSKRLY